MTKLTKVAISTVLLCSGLFMTTPANGADLSGGARAAILMDADTGAILYAHEAERKLPPASTTKIITALLGIELGKQREMVTVSAKAGAVDESTMYLDCGDQFTMEELLYGAMLKSGNDACVAIGEQIAGTESDFVNMMNIKAKLLGAQMTTFQNTNGLPNKQHLVTAKDMAKITGYALQNPIFAQIVSTKEKVVGSSDRGGKRYLKNTNKLLGKYPNAIGVKTGTTRAAGPCLVAAGQKDDQKLVTVVLNCPDRFGVSQQLLEYGFNSYDNQTICEEGAYSRNISVTGGTRTSIPVVFSENMKITLSKNQSKDLVISLNLPDAISAPVRRGQKVGTCQALLKGQLLHQVDMVAGESSDKKKVTRRWLDQVLEYLPN